MIVDKIENWHIYPFGPVWEKVFTFLRVLTPEAEEKKYEIQGDDVFAQVAGYETKQPGSALLEAHQKYIDIQMVLSGKEVIATASLDGLTVRTPYDQEKDIAFYEQAVTMDSIVMAPGTFALFYPHDAHMPGLMTDKQPEFVKKIVVKIKAELL